uniref:Uncharacterized protein n=1 Tax=Rangifer tarandus platyrhynchus TaxID=3082113 RepID=A0ACB0EHY8_RANTA|nr:unnamed protein product [Rangifer tarandus platyrhynchus]
MCGAAGGSACDSGAWGAGEVGQSGRGSSLSEAPREPTTAPAQAPLLSLDHPPSACPQGGVHLPGQGPPLYPGTRQRQVTPDHQLRPEPWALSSLTPGILPQPPTQGVSGQPCGWSGGAFVGPGSEGSPGWSAPLSRASPTLSGLQGSCGAETPSLGQESGRLQMEKRTQRWGPCGSTAPCPLQMAVPRTAGLGVAPGPKPRSASHAGLGRCAHALRSSGVTPHGAGTLPEGQVAGPPHPGVC